MSMGIVMIEKEGKEVVVVFTNSINSLIQSSNLFRNKHTINAGNVNHNLPKKKASCARNLILGKHAAPAIQGQTKEKEEVSWSSRDSTPTLSSKRKKKKKKKQKNNQHKNKVYPSKLGANHTCLFYNVRVCVSIIPPTHPSLFVSPDMQPTSQPNKDICMHATMQA